MLVVLVDLIMDIFYCKDREVFFYISTALELGNCFEIALSVVISLGI